MSKAPFLSGLSKYQCALLDIMWELDTYEDLMGWISTLDPQDKAMAMYLATRLRDSVEPNVDFEITDVSQAAALLEKF